MRVKSFAMLLPCGIDVFSGVEFVCCPRKAKQQAANSAAATAAPVEAAKKGGGYGVMHVGGVL